MFDLKTMFRILFRAQGRMLKSFGFVAIPAYLCMVAAAVAGIVGLALIVLNIANVGDGSSTTSVLTAFGVAAGAFVLGALLAAVTFVLFFRSAPGVLEQMISDMDEEMNKKTLGPLRG